MKEYDKERSNDVSTIKLKNDHHEIDLLDIISQLWKGKNIIIAVTIAAIFMGIFSLFFIKEKWTSTATVTLPSAGQVANYNAALTVLYADNPQDKPSIVTLQNQLFGRFSASMAALSTALQNLEQPLTLKILQTGANNDSLNISFVAHTSKDAQESLGKYIKQINEQVVTDYGDDIKRNLGVKTRELTNALDTYKQVALDKKEHRLDVIKQALIVAEASSVDKIQVNQAEFLSDDTLYLLGSAALNAMIVNEKSKPLEYNDDYYRAQRALLAVTHLKVEVDNLQSFRYISTPNLPIRRDSPKKVIILLISMIGGLIAGSVLVVCRNGLRRVQKHS